jgi:hypothetical protein
MPDYTGGGARMSSHGMSLIEDIKNGRTERQRRRDFDQKLALSGIQAGLMAASGLAKASDSEDKEAAAKREDEEKLAASPLPTYKPMKDEATDAKLPGWLTGKGGDTTELGVDNDVMRAVKKEAPSNPYDNEPAAEDEAYEAPATWGGRRNHGMMGSGY